MHGGTDARDGVGVGVGVLERFFNLFIGFCFFCFFFFLGPRIVGGGLLVRERKEGRGRV